MYVKQRFHWTHEQELDRLELGPAPARCLKGENDLESDDHKRARLIAGRAKEGLAEARRLKRAQEGNPELWGRRSLWFQEAQIDKVAGERDFERRRVAVREKKIAALERERTQLKETISLVRSVVEDAAPNPKVLRGRSVGSDK